MSSKQKKAFVAALIAALSYLAGVNLPVPMTVSARTGQIDHLVEEASK